MLRAGIFLVFLAVAGPALATLTAGPSRKAYCQMWEHRDMQGDRLDVRNLSGVTFGDNPNADTYWSERGGGWNDTISSVKSPPGCRLIVFEHEKGGGGSRTYNSRNVFYVGDAWNDRISSATCSCD